MNPNQPEVGIEASLKRMILIEIIFPMVLLILGIYHGLMQVLYRAGMIRSSQFLGLSYFQGLTLHGVVNAIVFTTFFAVAFGYAIIRYPLGKGDCSLHILSPVARASGFLHRRGVTGGRLMGRVLQLVAALLCLEARTSG